MGRRRNVVVISEDELAVLYPQAQYNGRGPRHDGEHMPSQDELTRIRRENLRRLGVDWRGLR